MAEGFSAEKGWYRAVDNLASPLYFVGGAFYFINYCV